MDDLEDILDELVIEGYENIDSVGRELVALEAEPDSPELLASIFRNLHTIKGTAGFFGLSNLETVAHAAENLLGDLRRGDIEVSSQIMDELPGAVDAIRAMLLSIKADGTDSFPLLIESLRRLRHREAGGEDRRRQG